MLGWGLFGGKWANTRGERLTWLRWEEGSKEANVEVSFFF